MGYNGKITTKYLEDFYTYFLLNKGKDSGEPLIQTNMSELEDQRDKIRADGEVISGNQDPDGNYGNSTVSRKTPGSLFKEVDTNAFLKDLGIPLDLPPQEVETGDIASHDSKDAKVWGDPHFENPKEGDKFDVQGEAGKSYNIWDDSNGSFTLDARFDKYGDGGATTIGAVRVRTGMGTEILLGKDGSPPVVNGVPVKPGQSVRTGDATISVSPDGNNVQIITDTGYNVRFQVHKGQYINFEVNDAPVDLDGDGNSRHGGLFGQVYGDGKATVGHGPQGQGAICNKS